ncbi:MAG: hypothetical protein IKL96_11215 [Kiritimatiellae bacterium]|nr:hypothetical protein [Kiritimatiellia bacterium]
MPATPEYAYQYDDIGNRITSTNLGTNRTYTANSLNQYSAIRTSDFRLPVLSLSIRSKWFRDAMLWGCLCVKGSTGDWHGRDGSPSRPQ